jgi:hypothetical protein
LDNELKLRYLTDSATKSHRCSICSKEFTRSDLLKRHQAVHQRQQHDDDADRESNDSRKRRKFIMPPSAPLDHSYEPFGNGTVPRGHGHEVHSSQSTNVQGSHRGSAYNAINSHIHDPDLHLPDVVHPNLSDATLLQPCALPDSGRQGDFNNVALHHSDSEWRHVANVPFDFSSMLLSNQYVQTGVMDNWFTSEFHAALRETGNEDQVESPLTNPTPQTQNDTQENDNRSFRHETSSIDVDEDFSGRARINRVSSPPNEASEEDMWPFAWNPRSRSILNSKPIHIPPEHRLFAKHDPTYDISENTYQKMVACLNFAKSHRFSGNHKDDFTLPSLSVVNLFIGLFIKYFLPQYPVLHLGTLRIEEDLPPQLLCAMVVIGAIYSFQRHTRRFSIVLLDLVRNSLQISLEYDIGLIRDDMFIYALVLVCHAGLWNGNKRAFELAEIVRGSVVNYCRRRGFSKHKMFSISKPENPRTDLESQWRSWIRSESAKRLSWAVYTLDTLFPCLLNLPPTISASEVADLECPCDDDLWQAPTAYYWKRLLGPTSGPISRTFAAAIGPFVVPFLASQASRNRKDTNDHNAENYGLPVLNLNVWSRFLVLLAIKAQIFELQQDILIAGIVCGDESKHVGNLGCHTDDLEMAETPRAMSVEENLSVYELADQMRLRSRGSDDTKDWGVWYKLARRKAQLLSKSVLRRDYLC